MAEQNTQKKIYLSGKISGDPDFKRKFEEKARELTELGYQVFNPAVHPDIFTWEQFMELDLLALSHCDSIYLLDDWKDSRGAQMEYDQALRLGKEIMFDSEHKVSVENKIKSEVTSFVSYKYRVELENGKMSPWQFSDKKPEPEDLKDVKNYYDDLNKRKDEQQIKQENPEHNITEEDVHNGYNEDELEAKEINEEIDEYYASNTVTNELPPDIDSFLQDMAQMHGKFNYSDIIQFAKKHNSENDIALKFVKKLYGIAKNDAQYDDEKEFSVIAEDLEKLIKGKINLTKHVKFGDVLNTPKYIRDLKNPEKVGNIETVVFDNDEPAQVASAAPGDDKNTEPKKYFWMTFGRERDLIRYSADNNGMTDAKAYSFDEALNNLMANQYDKKKAVRVLDSVIDNEKAGFKGFITYANHAATPENRKNISEMLKSYEKKADYDELEKRLVDTLSKKFIDVDISKKTENAENWTKTVAGRFVKDFYTIFKKEEGFSEADKKSFADYLLKKYEGKDGLISHLAAVVKDCVVRSQGEFKREKKSSGYER